MKLCSIYVITNTENDKVYVGQTWHKLKTRFDYHCSKHSGCTKLSNAISKYGKDKFRITTLSIVDSQNAANSLEVFWMKSFSSIRNGYNIKEGGYNNSFSEETKHKISASNMGRIVSDETKQKLSIAKIGEKNPNYGKPRSPEYKAYMSNFMKGNKYSLGFVQSEETKKKRAEAIRGFRHSEDFIIKMSGENGPNAKLNWVIVDDIRTSYANRKTKKITRQELADKYGVGLTTIGSILSHKTWVKK